MIGLIKDHPVEIVGLTGIVLAAALYALKYLGWIKMGAKTEDWNGTERRECAQHPALNQKVCSLYLKLEDVDKKLDTVSEKLQYILGALENRWGKRI